MIVTMKGNKHSNLHIIAACSISECNKPACLGVNVSTGQRKILNLATDLLLFFKQISTKKYITDE